MPVKLKIRKGDRVVVLTGKDKGKQGKSSRCSRATTGRSCRA